MVEERPRVGQGPGGHGDDGAEVRRPLLRIEDLATHFFLSDGTVPAVDGVSLDVLAGQTVCVVGESGCGKSITARSVLGLVDEPGRIVHGHVWWDPAAAPRPGEPDAARAPIDLASLSPRSEAMRRLRGREIAMIFQEPMASLSPMYTIGDQLVEAIRMHLPLSKRDARDRAVDLLRQVGIPRPQDRMGAYSFQLSGGLCQRVMIAIALSCSPRLLIADEPTTALDVTTQARIIDLLHQLQADTGMAIMFVTHDMGVVAEIADEVAVMYLGSVVEQGAVDAIFHDPHHPYTQGLLASVPALGGRRHRRMPTIPGQVPAPQHRPSGCRFHPRCAQRIAGVCETEAPLITMVDVPTRAVDAEPSDVVHDQHRVSCWLTDPQRTTGSSVGSGRDEGTVEASVGGLDPKVES